MTEGNIFNHILVFALPLLVGNLFQQFYNTVDTWVIGNYVENDAAYAAVGSVGPIINMIIGLFVGFSSGAGVVISQNYGAKRFDKVDKAVHTSACITLIMGVLFAVVGIILIPYMLNMMNTPANVFSEAKTYLTIYFSGIIGLMIYNIGSGILRAVGDSTRPFLFLVVSALLNVVLDLLFVIKFKMGVAGVAYATIIAQGVSALLVIFTLLTTSNCVKLIPNHLKIDKESLEKIVKVGFPAAIQLSITAFSNVFVQSYINQFGEHCMSGWTSYAKIDQFMFLPMQSLAIAATTFVGQNLGCGNVDRAKKGIKTTISMAVVSTVAIMIPILIFPESLVSFFNQNPEVIRYGAMLLRWISPFYVLCCFNQILAGALRGAGNSRAPMIIMLTSFVAFRQVYMFVMSNFICNDIIPIAMGYPAGWLLSSLLSFFYYKKVDLRKKVVI
ncbi:MAG: MATE family efflux transporter [Clostridia bacterium]|nr:MATE family efflux transporter [Clostridia bacterium]